MIPHKSRMRGALYNELLIDQMCYLFVRSEAARPSELISPKNPGLHSSMLEDLKLWEIWYGFDHWFTVAHCSATPPHPLLSMVTIIREKWASLGTRCSLSSFSAFSILRVSRRTRIFSDFVDLVIFQCPRRNSAAPVAFKRQQYSHRHQRNTRSSPGFLCCCRVFHGSYCGEISPFRDVFLWIL